jgi:diaminohydroxyphosphoribosylaminopyrimidine deaminase/5-amino-6-(5-phosphoribosylamino)uracil reductase
LNIDSILLEGGGTVNESALAQGVVSKLLLYMAPIIIGGEQSKTFVEGMGVENPDEAYPMQFASVAKLGEDIKITAYPKRKERINCLQEL